MIHPHSKIIFGIKEIKYWSMLQHGLCLKTCYLKEVYDKRLHIVWFHLYEMPRKGKYMKTESQSRGIVIRIETGYKQDQKNFRGRWVMFYTWITVMITQLYKFTKNHSTLMTVNFTLFKLYLNKSEKS